MSTSYANWSVWDEDDADSHPSDPGVTHCKEWFIGRWPTRASEPRERILIGSFPGAQQVGRRIALALNNAEIGDRNRAPDEAVAFWKAVEEARKAAS